MNRRLNLKPKSAIVKTFRSEILDDRIVTAPSLAQYLTELNEGTNDIVQPVFNENWSRNNVTLFDYDDINQA
jgi:hypothetical protein